MIAPVSYTHLDVYKRQRVDLTGQYSNPSGPLKLLLEAASAPQESRQRPITPSRRRRPELRLGAVKRAVLSVVVGADEPIRARDVHAAVEQRLQRAVSYDNVRKVLAASARDPSSGVARARRGRYAWTAR